MKVTCKVIQDLLPLYVDGVCSPDTAALVEEHLKDCAPCQEAYHALKEAPDPSSAHDTTLPKKETKIVEGFKQIRRTFRKKWVKIAVLAVAATLVVTMGLAFFANTYRIVPKAEEILQGVSVEDGLLTVNLETPFLLAPMTTFTPSTTQGTTQTSGGGESILLITTSYTPSDWISCWMRGEHGPALNEPYSWDLTYTLTEEAWNDKFSEEAAQWEAQLRADGVSEEEIKVLGQNVEHQLPHGDIQKVYYYDVASPRVWDSNEEAQQALAEHGTLLWTAEDGVVYQP